MAEQGFIKADPISESVSLELDMINILYVFVDFFLTFHIDVVLAFVSSKFLPCVTTREDKGDRDLYSSNWTIVRAPNVSFSTLVFYPFTLSAQEDNITIQRATK